MAADGENGNGLTKLANFFKFLPSILKKNCEKPIMALFSLRKITRYFLLGVFRAIVCVIGGIPLIFSVFIVNRGTGYETLQTSLAITKELLYLTMHTFCFSINGDISIGQLLEQKFNIYCGCARSWQKNDNKNIEQRHFRYHSHCALLAMVYFN